MHWFWTFAAIIVYKMIISKIMFVRVFKIAIWSFCYNNCRSILLSYWVFVYFNTLFRTCFFNTQRATIRWKYWWLCFLKALFILHAFLKNFLENHFVWVISIFKFIVTDFFSLVGFKIWVDTAVNQISDTLHIWDWMLHWV